MSKTNSLIDGAAATSATLSDFADSTVVTTVAAVLTGLVIVVAAGFFAMRAWLVRPIKALAEIMVRLANGDLAAVNSRTAFVTDLSLYPGNPCPAGNPVGATSLAMVSRSS